MKTSEREIDLRYSSIISDEFKESIQRSAFIARPLFNQIISNYLDSKKLPSFILFHEPFCRNTYSSPTFFYFTTVVFVEKFLTNYIEGDKDNLILVDSPMQKLIINRITKAKNLSCKVKYVQPLAVYYNLLRKIIISPCKAFLYRIFQFYMINNSLSSTIDNQLKEIKNICLVDTFITPTYLDEKKWYGSFSSYLNQDRLSRTFFVPTFTLFTPSDYMKLLSRIRQKSRPQILKDDYLSLNDIIQSTFSAFKLQFRKLPRSYYKDYDISYLFEEGLRFPPDYLSLIESYINLKFFSNLKKEKVNITHSIDWFEGHAIDKSWNYAVKYNYPNVKRLGYRSIISLPLSLCSIPIPVESRYQMLPDIFLIPGPSVRPILTEFNKELVSYGGPAFRFEYLQEISSHISLLSSTSILRVLVTLPISTLNSKHILNSLLIPSNSFDSLNRKIIFSIRKHPCSLIDVQSFINKSPKCFTISPYKTISESYKHTDILITEASTTSMEAIVLGIPTIILSSNLPGLIDNPVPLTIPKTLVKYPKDVKELEDHLIRFSELTEEDVSQINQDSINLREKYFKSVTNQSATEILDSFYQIGIIEKKFTK